jgi:hypothetical protein
MNKKLGFRLARLSATTWIAAAIFCITLLVFVFSQIHQVTDSNYSMLVSQSLIEHGTFKLDAYAIPRLGPKNRGYYTSNGAIYQLEFVDNHLYYHLPSGSSVLSVPYVALMKLFGIKATNPDGTYNVEREIKIEVSLAGLLMSALAVIFFYTARLRLPTFWSALVALGATFGTQVWSTASRALWTDTWGIVLLGLVVFLLLAHETGKREVSPILLASLLAWTFFVRPTNAAHILAVTIYLLIYHRRLFIPYAITGAAWLAGFMAYSWHNYKQLLPTYYHSSRLNFSVFWTALAGNLVSPARGLLVYVPILFFVGYLLARYRGYIKFVRLVVLSLAITVGHLISVSAFSHWWGGHCFGPRFTTGLLPWLVLLAILGIEALLRWRLERQAVNQSVRWKAQLIAGGALLLISMIINARGAMSHATWLWNSRPVSIDEFPERLWDWRQPQFMAGWLPQALPRRFPPATDFFDFSTPASDPYLWSGWSTSVREEPFRWSDGKEALMIFRLDEIRDLRLRIKLFPFISKGKVEQQRIEFRLNERPLETLLIKEEGVNEYELRLPKNLLAEKNLLVFGLPDAASPQALGLGIDTRQLGIGVFWLRLQTDEPKATE